MVRHEFRPDEAAENDELASAVYDELRDLMLQALRDRAAISAGVRSDAEEPDEPAERGC
jgi:hypothetical protein